VVPSGLLTTDGSGGCGGSKQQQEPHARDAQDAQGGGNRQVEGESEGEELYREWRYRNGVAEGRRELSGLLPLECNLAGLNAVWALHVESS
jgi:hypothetical protein